MAFFIKLCLALMPAVIQILGVAPSSNAQSVDGIPNSTPPDRTGIVQLFEWPWADIAKECATFLGPKRVWAVQVSPPSEHAQIFGNPWWERYQPVSYDLDSRSGDRDAFANMTATCRNAGVGVIVDAVLNHMAGGDGTSITGRPYSKYQYPFFGPQDFHIPKCDIRNYQNQNEVQGCELSNLADLRTDSDYVRGRQAAYLSDLLSLGVLGFRIDAAKHVPSTDLTAVLARTTGSSTGQRPYIYSEVINCGTEAVGPSQYTAIGDVNEFNYGVIISGVFRSRSVAQLLHPEQSWNNWGLLPSYFSVPFMSNHDTVRGGPCSSGVLTYKDGSLYNLAQVFALAYPYGNVLVTSGYAFNGFDQGPPAPGNNPSRTAGPWQPGDVDAPSGCKNSNPWVCEHRWENIASMFAFRAATLKAWSVDNKWDDGFSQIAFSRGSLGFVAINVDASRQMNQVLQTGMPGGTYCQVLSGAFDPDSRKCSGSTVTVGPDGRALVVVQQESAFAIHTGSKLS